MAYAIMNINATIWHKAKVYLMFITFLLWLITVLHRNLRSCDQPLYHCKRLCDVVETSGYVSNLFLSDKFIYNVYIMNPETNNIHAQSQGISYASRSYCG